MSFYLLVIGFFTALTMLYVRSGADAVGQLYIDRCQLVRFRTV